MRVGSLLVDFDGTACAADASEVLLERFGDPRWTEFDDLVDRGEMGLREAAHHQVAMLRGSPHEMLEFAVANCPMDPTFAPFVDWAERQSLPISLVSDGFGFYILPILLAAGLDRLDVISNEFVFDSGEPRLLHPNGHPECVGCGTCKLLAAVRFRERFGSVAFIGEGQSDRYGALYSDVVFAKDSLAGICERDGVPYLPWNDFDDVRRKLEGIRAVPGPVAPKLCPGWEPAGAD